MENLDMMKDFASTFVGDGFYLIINSNGSRVLVHTIEIIQKVDETCKFKEIPVGGYFFRILAVDANDRQSYILCNWSEQLLQNLITQRAKAKNAGFNKIVMTNETETDPNTWALLWGEDKEIVQKLAQKPSNLGYIS